MNDFSRGSVKVLFFAGVGACVAFLMFQCEGRNVAPDAGPAPEPVISRDIERALPVVENAALALSRVEVPTAPDVPAPEVDEEWTKLRRINLLGKLKNLRMVDPRDLLRSVNTNPGDTYIAPAFREQFLSYFKMLRHELAKANGTANNVFWSEVAAMFEAPDKHGIVLTDVGDWGRLRGLEKLRTEASKIDGIDMPAEKKKEYGDRVRAKINRLKAKPPKVKMRWVQRQHLHTWKTGGAFSSMTSGTFSDGSKFQFVRDDLPKTKEAREIDRFAHLEAARLVVQWFQNQGVLPASNAEALVSFVHNGKSSYFAQANGDEREISRLRRLLAAPK